MLFWSHGHLLGLYWYWYRREVDMRTMGASQNKEVCVVLFLLPLLFDLKQKIQQSGIQDPGLRLAWT